MAHRTGSRQASFVPARARAAAGLPLAHAVQGVAVVSEVIMAVLPVSCGGIRAAA